jgi:hypothetical protein
MFVVFFLSCLERGCFEDRVRSGGRKDIQQQVVRWVSSNARRGELLR